MYNIWKRSRAFEPEDLHTVMKYTRCASAASIYELNGRLRHTATHENGERGRINLTNKEILALKRLFALKTEEIPIHNQVLAHRLSSEERVVDSTVREGLVAPFLDQMPELAALVQGYLGNGIHLEGKEFRILRGEHEHYLMARRGNTIVSIIKTRRSFVVFFGEGNVHMHQRLHMDASEIGCMVKQAEHKQRLRERKETARIRERAAAARKRLAESEAHLGTIDRNVDTLVDYSAAAVGIGFVVALCLI